MSARLFKFPGTLLTSRRLPLLAQPLPATALLAFGFGLATAAHAQPRGCPTIQLVGSKGQINRSSPVSGESEAVRFGACVLDGNILSTGKSAIGRFRLTSPSEAGAVSVGPESSVLVGFPIGGHPTKLLLTRGQVRISSSARSIAEAARLHILRMTVVPKVKGTVIQAQTWRNDEEAWIVVVHGSAEVRLGNQAPGLTLNAGQSAYVTSEQETLPHAVALDTQEISALQHDNNFEHSIADLLTIEITPEQLAAQKSSQQMNGKLQEEKVTAHFTPDSRTGEMTLDTNMDMNEEQDETLDSLVGSSTPKTAHSEVTSRPRQAPRPSAPPASVDQMPQAAPRAVVAAPVSTTVVRAPLAPQGTPAVSPLDPSQRENFQPETSAGENEVGRESAAEKSWFGRADFGPVFYNDAVGIDVSGAALRQLGGLGGPSGLEGTPAGAHSGKISMGGGVGYSSASKNQLNVHNWKFFGIVNDQVPVSKIFMMTPELQLGLASEGVQDSTTVFASGAAFYVSARVLFEAQIGRLPDVHPGLALGYQDYAGGTGLSSVILAVSLRF